MEVYIFLLRKHQIKSFKKITICLLG